MQKAYTVAQINSYIKNMFSQDYLLNAVSVKGEISNCKYHASGHIYFTLKDKSSVLACVMFAGNRTKGLSFPLKEGMQVIVSGNIDIYERDGKYQLYARNITQDGIGELYEKFERLKNELSQRGMFDPMYKKPIPALVKRLGVVTAPNGAAIRDIISISKARNPYIEIILYPALVQGEGAVNSIVKGIKMLEMIGVDAMIVGRGGGSLEDLWAFNEEAVAQAIFDCDVPIISAVGHETDTTIADFVADVRAETPSAAAQIAVCQIKNVTESIEELKRRLYKNISVSIESNRNRVELKKSNLLRLSPKRQIADRRFRLMQDEEHLKKSMLDIISMKRHELMIRSERLNGVSPLEKLKQGYSYAVDANSKNINSIERVNTGDSFDLYVTDGIISAAVTKKEKKEI
ncbi:MAG: exodeoxyribonuclease VII large subunit [Lachnospiraceae bacterium]|nr:exodeoxyribonuclease VII large subunit [Lachnospiraceae bacterium]